MPVDTIIVTVTPECNLRCAYCQNEPALSEFKPEPIPLELLRKATEQYRELADSTGESSPLRFCFSGGEPLLAGLAFFEEVLKMQREIVGDSREVANTLQTNGTLIDSEWAEFFAGENFGVSVSIDGHPLIQNRQRPMADVARSSAEATVEGIRRLKEAGNRYGTLTVLSSLSVDYPAEIFDYLAALEPSMMGFLPCVDRGPAISASDYGRFMCGLFDAWYAERRSDLFVREFTHVIQGMVGIPHRKGCQFGGDCPRHVNLSLDGTVWVCDQYIGKSEGYLGSLRDKTLTEIVEGPRFKRFRESTRRLPDACAGCRYLALCNAGCMYRRESSEKRDYLCEGRRMMFAHIEHRLEEITTEMVDKAREMQLC